MSHQFSSLPHGLLSDTPFCSSTCFLFSDQVKRRWARLKASMALRNYLWVTFTTYVWLMGSNRPQSCSSHQFNTELWRIIFWHKQNRKSCDWWSLCYQVRCAVIRTRHVWSQQCVPDMSLDQLENNASCSKIPFLWVSHQEKSFITAKAIWWRPDVKIKTLLPSIWNSVKDFLQKARGGYCKSVSTHSYSPRVDTSDRQMNGLREGLESWG